MNQQEILFFDDAPTEPPRSLCIAVISEPDVQYDRLRVGECVYGLSKNRQDSRFFLVATPCVKRGLKFFSPEELVVGEKIHLHPYSLAFGIEEICSTDLSKLDMVFVANLIEIRQVLLHNIFHYVGEESVIEFIEYLQEA